jgi:hypothetical protein
MGIYLKWCAAFQSQSAGLDTPQTYFGTLQVGQNCDKSFLPMCGLAYFCYTSGMLIVAAMGKIQAKNIYTGCDKFVD